MNTETPYTLCAEMLATLRANLLRGTITTQDDAQFGYDPHQVCGKLYLRKP